MRFKYLALLAVLAIIVIPASVAHAQISFGIQFGGGYPDVPPPEPVCPYGYYSYPPYACAPVGYYGPQWFNDGVFIGAGPWYHYGWGYRDGWDHDRWEHDRGEWGRGGWAHDRGWGGGRGYIGNGFHGGGGGFRGHDGGGGFRGHGGGFHGGGRR
jgi:hypothetical protein